MRQVGLVDLLIVGAIVEARSCERFAALWPLFPSSLGRYYKSLLRSEGVTTKTIWLSPENDTENSVDQRLSHFLTIDQRLIQNN